MPISRYRKARVMINNHENYEEFIEPRGKKSILQYTTQELSEPDPGGSVHHKLHLWKQADKYWKLSQEYYEDPRYWWVIAQYNQKPTEAHLSNGDIIVIPLPVTQAIAALGYNG